jgi:hypothetical protein
LNYKLIKEFVKFNFNFWAAALSGRAANEGEQNGNEQEKKN